MEMKFYKCGICGQIAVIVKDTGAPLVCCGEEMEELIPGLADASREKHVPVIENRNGLIRVTVGSALHPMTGEHHIEWILLQTTGGNQRRELKPGDDPSACFRICEEDEVTAAWAYCNLHGLWKTDIR